MHFATIVELLNKLRESLGKLNILPEKTLEFIKTICIIITLCVVSYNAYMDSVKSHKDPTTRFVVSGAIRNDLTELRKFSGAGKAFVLGYHNGVANFTRIPFVFADMRYEVTADSVEYTSDLYSNVSLDKFQFCEQHITDNIWHGPITALNDHRLESVFRRHGVKYVYFSAIKDGKGIPVATVALLWYDSENQPIIVRDHKPTIQTYVKNIKTTLMSYE